MTIIIFILILGAIIFVHELGHFLFAKLFKVYVHEFALGMGPKIFGKQGKETEYTLRAIPIGGFCQLAGEDGEEDKRIGKDRMLQNKPAWQRFLIMFFGAGFNFIFAILLFFSVALFNGSPSFEPVITAVEENFPAYKAGIEPGDEILKINGNVTKTMDDVALYLALADSNKNTSIKIKKDDGSINTYKVMPKKIKEGKKEVYKFGIGLQTETRHGFVNSVKYTVVKTGALFKQMGITLKSLFTGDIKLNELSGPVGIYTIVDEQSEAGFVNLIFLMAFLSINVGFINLLPFPAFDGGRILFIIIEKIKGSPVKGSTENMFHTVGFFLLILLILYITFNDVFKLFG